MNQMQGQDCLLRDVSPLILLSLQTLQVQGGPSTCKAKELGSQQEEDRSVMPCTQGEERGSVSGPNTLPFYPPSFSDTYHVAYVPVLSQPALPLEFLLFALEICPGNCVGVV